MGSGDNAPARAPASLPPQLQEGRLCLFVCGTLLNRVGAASAGTAAVGLPRRGLYLGPRHLGNLGGGGPPVLPCFTRIHPLVTLASTDYAMFFHVASILPPPLHVGVLGVHLQLTPSVGLRPVAGFNPLPEVRLLIPSPLPQLSHARVFGAKVTHGN